jgi:hypothetical protein
MVGGGDGLITRSKMVINLQGMKWRRIVGEGKRKAESVVEGKRR